MNISERIKNHTQAGHQTLEKMIVAQIRGIQTQDDYADLLICFYGYLSGVETKINHQISEKHLPDIHKRRKLSLILEDLRVVGSHTPPEADARFLPEISDVFQAFGSMYVMEGSTLGGPHIAAMIRKRLPDMPYALRFFTGYGEETPDKWELFKNTLNHLSTNETTIYSILCAADETFNKFIKWIQHIPSIMPLI